MKKTKSNLGASKEKAAETGVEKPKLEYWAPKAGDNGMNELHQAAYNLDPDAVLHWIKYGFDVNSTHDGGWTALVWAINMSQTGTPADCKKIIDHLFKYHAIPSFRFEGPRALLDFAKDYDQHVFLHLKKAIQQSGWLGVHYRVSLRITGCGSLHSEITEKTGLRPSQHHRRGKKFTNDVWLLRSPLKYSWIPAAHVEWLWEKIKPHKTYFKKIIAQAESVEILVSIRAKPNFVFTLRADQKSLVFFQELGIPLNFDVMTC